MPRSGCSQNAKEDLFDKQQVVVEPEKEEEPNEKKEEPSEKEEEESSSSSEEKTVEDFVPKKKEVTGQIQEKYMHHKISQTRLSVELPPHVLVFCPLDTGQQESIPGGQTSPVV